MWSISACAPVSQSIHQRCVPICHGVASFEVFAPSVHVAHGLVTVPSGARFWSVQDVAPGADHETVNEWPVPVVPFEVVVSLSCVRVTVGAGGGGVEFITHVVPLCVVPSGHTTVWLMLAVLDVPPGPVHTTCQ